MTRTEKLLALAEAATPRMWKLGRKRISLMSKKPMYSVNGPTCVSDYDDWGFTLNSAKYIAAANPKTIKQLVELCRLQHEALQSHGVRLSEDDTKVDEAIAAFTKFEGGK